MSSIELNNIPSHISSTNTTTSTSTTTTNNNDNLTTTSENYTRSREGYSGNRGRDRGRGRRRGGGGGGRGGSFHDHRSYNYSSNQESTSTNTSPQTNNNDYTQSPPPTRSNSTPRRNRGRVTYSPRNSQGSQSHIDDDNNTNNNTDNNISESNRSFESTGGGRGYSKNRFHHRHQYRNNNNKNSSNNNNNNSNNNNNDNAQNNYNQNNLSIESSTQNENRGQYHSRSSHRRNNRSDRSKGVADENQIDSNQNNNASTRMRSMNSQSVDRGNNNESDSKGKNPIVPVTESSQRSSRPHTRPMKSSMIKLSPEEIKDVLTSITHGLSTSTYECMICCENIRPNHKTWSCGVCWAVFHLNCTQKWAKKSSNDSRSSETWRCPGCQNNSDVIPEIYKCFCGKVENPPNNRYLTPHSCGNICGRKRDCPHDCTLLCHPGPCPPCSAMAPAQYCYCGRKTFQLRCVDTDYGSGKSCGETCGQLLSCGKHYCENECHDGSCPKCSVFNVQKCYCGKTEREAKCDDGISVRCYEELNVWTGFFSCKNPCNRLLECGHHSCTKGCHPVTGDTEPCPLDPSIMKTCPCGDKSIISLLGHERVSCTEEIPLCGNICKKLLSCGHECQELCHHGDCKPCTARIRVKCRCGSTEYERICSEVIGETGEPPTCDKICRGNRNCGRHECNTRCCPSANKLKPSKKRVTLQDDDDENHRCTLICGKKLQCGNHNCQLLCHRGNCMRCLEASFEELTCHCGRTKVFPPIPCGKKIPPCTFNCIRDRNCDHSSVEHLCHGDEEPCPPCPFLVSKKCMCGKSIVNNIPCHRTNVSCGQVCDLPVSCGGHRCKRTCHLGDCLANTSGQCTQICGKLREACGHPCSVQCHAPARCPEDILCQTKIIINCNCGHLSQEVTCNVTMENSSEMKNRQLQCNDFCALAERNRRLANALEITDRVGDGPFIKAVPEYEEDLFKYFAFNKDWAKNIETTLGDFIMKSEKPTLNFPPMKPPHRHFIHGLCVHYRLSSESVDVEPKRSVVVKKKSDTIIPPILLSQAYINYNNKSNSSNNLLEQSARKQKQPINAIYLSELQFGMTMEELHKVIEPLIKRNKFQIKWVLENDAIVLPLVSSMHMDELENLLAKLKLLVKDLVVSKGIAAWVEYCWVNSKYEVVWREREKFFNNFDGSSTNRMIENDSRIPSIGNNNPFDMLQVNVPNSAPNSTPPWNTGVGGSGSNINNKNQSSPSLLFPKKLIVQQEAKETANNSVDDIVDSWESICDE